MSGVHTRRLLDTRALEAEPEEFARARNWEPYHSPKNLAMALTGEVDELVELFQWLTEEQSAQLTADPATARAAQDELAGVLMYPACDPTPHRDPSTEE
jgi:NTP pyrophosphatase (non-canonical NTP hydrolase)